VTDSATKYIWFYCRAESEMYQGLLTTAPFFFNYSLLCFIWSSPNLRNLQRSVIPWFFKSNWPHCTNFQQQSSKFICVGFQPEPNLYTYITYLILPDSCYLAALESSYIHTIHTFSQHNSNFDAIHHMKKPKWRTTPEFKNLNLTYSQFSMKPN
jgi:hypothetical protein